MRQLDTPALLRNQAFIDGAFVGEAVEAVTNPSTGEELARVPRLGAREAETAVNAAARAFPGWAGLTGKERSAVLRRWFDLIIEHRQDLATILTAEQGKPFAEALGEIDYAASYVEFYAEEAKRLAGEILSSHRADARILVFRQPIGVVAAITPWNFPAAMITRKIAPALAAGCAVVVKPAPETPLTALALAELCQQAGFPPGVINVVMGDAVAIGKGGRLELGGHRHELGGSYFEPTLLTGASPDMHLAQEETFGPVAAIFRFDTEAEALDAANATETGLAAYLYTRDNSRVFRMIEGLEYGMVGVNTGLISTELAPFGGIKQSGNSREGSRHGIEEFTELKYACIGI